MTGLRSAARRRRAQPLLGVLFIVAGYALLSADSLGWDRVLLTVSPGHGVDLSDVLGTTSVVLGVAALWTARRTG